MYVAVTGKSISSHPESFLCQRITFRLCYVTLRKRTLFTDMVTYTTPCSVWNCLPFSLEEKRNNLVLCLYVCLFIWECLKGCLYRVCLNLSFNNCAVRHRTGEIRTKRCLLP